jgi:exonuclease SbcC
MNEKKVTFGLLLLLICLLFLAGCKEIAEERDRSAAEAEKAKAELARVEVALRQTQSERDELVNSITEIAEELENVKSELAAVKQARGELQNRVEGLTGERDAAITKATETQVMVEELANQLSEKAKEIQEFEALSKELLTTIQQLQEIAEQTDEPVTEELYEEPSRQP